MRRSLLAVLVLIELGGAVDVDVVDNTVKGPQVLQPLTSVRFVRLAVPFAISLLAKGPCH